MAFTPNAHGPLNLRSLYYWVYKNLIGVGDYTDTELGDHIVDPNGHPPFAGAGTTGFVPDPVVEEKRALRDTGEWRRASEVYFQSDEPVDGVPGDFWVVLTGAGQ